MGALADRLGAMVVETTSPDGRITATTCGDSQISVAFRPGAYRGYTDDELARQLATLATLTWVAYTKETRRIVRAEVDDLIEDDAIEFGTERRRYREGVEQLVTEATSANESIWISTRALLDWQITIGAGSVRYYTEADFLAEMDSALTAVLAGHRRQATLLAREIFGGTFWSDLASAEPDRPAPSADSGAADAWRRDTWT